jgi:Big-like domain-containing protein
MPVWMRGSRWIATTVLPALLMACTTARIQPPIESAPGTTTLPGNRPPTVLAGAEPASTAPGGQVTLNAEVYDPDGDSIKIQWTAPSGTFNNPAGARTYWTAPQTAGAVTITITVDDGRATAKATVTVTVK